MHSKVRIGSFMGSLGRLLLLALAANCSPSRTIAQDGGALIDDALAGDTRIGDARPIGSASDGQLEASAPDAELPATCPAPTKNVSCKMATPECAPGHYPEVDPCLGGHCPTRCWTGKCLPCGSECEDDSDCTLVGRHGCCGMAGDCAQGCFWAAPKDVLSSDPCSFVAECPVPDPPAGCPTECTDDARCLACPHCAPDYARCEGGICISAWTHCEPFCACD